MRQEWALNVKRQCEEQRVAVFFKTKGAVGILTVSRGRKTGMGGCWREERGMRCQAGIGLICHAPIFEW